jgi:hypothetical protein
MEGEFSELVRLNEHDLHYGRCRIKGCQRFIHSFHHRLKNTETNRKLFPLFIDSPMNCAGLCEQHHVRHASVESLDITEEEAKNYEEFLESLKNSI